MRNPTLTKAMSAYATANSAVPPLVAVVRLYERAAANMQRAREAAREKRFDLLFQEVDRTLTILAALDSVLDMGKGGDVAQALRRYYRITIRQVAGISAARDPVAAADAAVGLIGVMAKAWNTIAAERGVGRHTPPAASVKGSSASVIERSMDHAHVRFPG